MQTIRINISGRVQGVWFRASTKHKAQEFDITGWVKNEPDGMVTIEATGEQAALDQLVSWCHEGSTHARVEKVHVEIIEFKNYPTFDVIR